MELRVGSSASSFVALVNSSYARDDEADGKRSDQDRRPGPGNARADEARDDRRQGAALDQLLGPEVLQSVGEPIDEQQREVGGEGDPAGSRDQPPWDAEERKRRDRKHRPVHPVMTSQ